MAKLYATVNSAEGALELERATPSTPWTFVGEGAPDLVRTGPSTFSLVHNGRSYQVLVLKEDRENNTVRLRIGGGTYTVRLQDEQSRMLRSLGTWARKARIFATDLRRQSGIDDVLRSEGLHQSISELRNLSSRVPA